MKKMIMFLSLLFIPFMVSAVDVNKIDLVFQEGIVLDSELGVEVTEIDDEILIKANIFEYGQKFYKYDRKGNVEKTLDALYHRRVGNYIYNITEENDSEYKVSVYDLKLNLIKENKISKFIELSDKTKVEVDAYGLRIEDEANYYDYSDDQYNFYISKDLKVSMHNKINDNLFLIKYENRLILVDKNYKIIKEIAFDSSDYSDYVLLNNKIYTLDNINNVDYVKIYDTSFNILKEKTVNNFFALLYTDGKNVYHCVYEDRECKIINDLEYTDSDYHYTSHYYSLYEEQNMISEWLDSDLFNYKKDAKGNYIVILEESLDDKKEKFSLIYFSSKGEEIFRKEMFTTEYDSNYIIVYRSSIDFNDNYIAVGVGSDKFSEYVAVYDYEGNLIRKLDYEKNGKNYIVSNVTFTSEGFVVILNSQLTYGNGSNEESNTENNNVSFLNNPSTLENEPNFYVLYYEIPYYIETKVLGGKGTIDVEKLKLFKWQEVSSIVSPAEEYVLKSLVVYDSEGKEIVFSENSFIMPASNVIIEAEFEVKNSETSDIEVVLIFFIFLVSGLVGVYLVQKRNELMN